ncbi:MAG TPA: hypothetical protein VGD79_09875 [Thermoanaerobaculia bacterium]|jgi:hypothetical protein
MHPLVGLWSIDDLFVPGAQEDTYLVFKEDGTGWIELAHYVSCEVDTFHWESPSDGVVRIGGDRYLADGQESNSSFQFSELPYAIVEEETPDGTTRPVVTFARPLWLPQKQWGLIRRDVAGMVVPEAKQLTAPD